MFEAVDFAPFSLDVAFDLFFAEHVIDQAERVKVDLFDDGGEFRANFIHDEGGELFELTAMAGGDVEGARLVAADDSCGLGARTGEGDGETGDAGKIAAAGYREHDRGFGQAVEGAW